jgi:hypothetical protein
MYVSVEVITLGQTITDHCNSMITIRNVIPSSYIFNNIKEFVQPKMSLNNREFLIWKREGGRGGERDGCAGQQAGIFKVRLGLGEI